MKIIMQLTQPPKDTNQTQPATQPANTAKNYPAADESLKMCN